MARLLLLLLFVFGFAESSSASVVSACGLDQAVHDSFTPDTRSNSDVTLIKQVHPGASLDQCFDVFQAFGLSRLPIVLSPGEGTYIALPIKRPYLFVFSGSSPPQIIL